MKAQKPRSLLGIEPLTASEIVDFLNSAKKMDPSKPRNLVRGRRVALLFYEN